MQLLAYIYDLDWMAKPILQIWCENGRKSKKQVEFCLGPVVVVVGASGNWHLVPWTSFFCTKSCNSPIIFWIKTPLNWTSCSSTEMKGWIYISPTSIMSSRVGLNRVPFVTINTGCICCIVLHWNKIWRAVWNLENIFLHEISTF